MITGRNTSFLRTIDQIEKTFFNQSINIVETGTIRGLSETSKMGDGWSSYHWGMYCNKTNSNLWCVDIDPNAIDHTKEVHKKYVQNISVEYHVKDSIKFLREFDKQIDFLFLDSYDYCGDEENIRKCHEHQLNEIKAAYPKLSDFAIILIDDVFNDETYDGKGKLSIPFLLENGFEIIHYIDTQILLKRHKKNYGVIGDTFYINLDNRKDRKKNVETRLKNIDLVSKRFPAIEVNKENVINVWNKKNPRGHYWEGTFKSHQNIVQHAKEQNLENVLIFEDDAMFVSDFYKKAWKCIDDLANKNWDILYFGGEPNGICEKYTENISKVKHGVYCAHAYLINRSFYDNILNLSLEHVANIDLALVNYDTNKRHFFISRELLSYQDTSFSDAHGHSVDSQSIFQKAYNEFVL